MPKEILVVDNDLKFRKMMQFILMPKDYIVWLAGSGEEGLQLLTEHEEIGAILFDYRSWMRGDREFIEQICANEKMSRIPRMCITADAQIEKLPDLAEIAQDYLIKPFDNEVLYKKLGRLTGKEQETLD